MEKMCFAENWCSPPFIHVKITLHICLMQSILLNDDTTDSDTDSTDSDFSLSREELHDMLRLHRYTRQHQSKFHSDREVQTQTQLQLPLAYDVKFHCVSFHLLILNISCSFTSISTTVPDFSLPMTPSMSSSATFWAQRKRKSKMRRNLKVWTKKKSLESFTVLLMSSIKTKFPFSYWFQPNWKRWRRRKNEEKEIFWMRDTLMSLKSLQSFHMMLHLPWWKRNTSLSSSWMHDGVRSGSPSPKRRSPRLVCETLIIRWWS